MNYRSCRLFLLSLLAAAITAELAPWPTAQTLAGPAVNVVRNTSLEGALWPADFNGDGVTDLLTNDSPPGDWSASAGRVAVSLGRGDGTFTAPIVSGFVGRSVGTADMNGDGRRDALAIDPRSAESPRLVILPGRGDGTFAAARAAAPLPADFTFALTRDLNNDGRRDLVVVSEPEHVQIYPGNGDFTFDAPVQLFTGYWPHGGAIADLNEDGLRDLAIANRYSSSITVALNRGTLTFTTTEIPIGRGAMDVTAGDANGDGRIDLFVAAASEPYHGAFEDGYAYVLLGNGDGTFAEPVAYQVARGALRIVIGDFTGDGRLDIATGNRSFYYVDDCAWPWKGWDSVSVLAGAGAGRFDEAWTFSLGDQRLTIPDERFRNSLVSLATSDLNGDRRTDLIASHGALLFTRAPAANRPPVVDAGPDRTVMDPDGHLPLPSSAVDPDNHLLEYRWTSNTGFARPWPLPCDYTEQGTHTYTVSVDDGHGGVASDSVNVTMDRGSDNRPPTVSLTKPAGGTSHQSPGAIDVAASASDADGSIRAVEFFANSVRIGYDVTAPYEARWEDVPPGTYRLNAVAHDDGGALAASESVTITVTNASASVLLADDFNDNDLDRTKWVVTNLFTGTEDSAVPVRETNQRIEIGPLLQASGSHYNGLASRAAYDFRGAAATVRLVQPPNAASAAQAFFAVGVNSSNYYRFYVSASTLYAERRIHGTKAAVRTLPYSGSAHQYLRLRHDSGSGRVIYETAPASAGGPGAWSVVATDTWNSAAIPPGSVRFEIKAGTSVAESNAPGLTVFDDFSAARIPAPGRTLLLEDDFDAAALDSSKWSVAVLSGTQDPTIPVSAGGGHLRIGPLKDSVSGSHYNGILSRSRFDMTGAAASVQLARWPYTAVYAMWTIPIDAANHYRIYLEGEQYALTLRFEEKIAGAKRALGSVPFGVNTHDHWRIRHRRETDEMLFETAPDAGGRPGAWTLQVATPRRLDISGVRFELKAGTSRAVEDPGVIELDDFRAVR